MADASLELMMRQQERVLDELRLVRADISDFKAEMEVQSASMIRLDQSIHSMTGVVRALAFRTTGRSSSSRRRSTMRALFDRGRIDPTVLTTVGQRTSWSLPPPPVVLLVQF